MFTLVDLYEGVAAPPHVLPEVLPESDFLVLRSVPSASIQRNQVGIATIVSIRRIAVCALSEQRRWSITLPKRSMRWRSSRLDDDNWLSARALERILVPLDEDERMNIATQTKPVPTSRNCRTDGPCLAITATQFRTRNVSRAASRSRHNVLSIIADA